ncbi:MAG: FAD:protein FMN transferase [Armatimonadetes bacterium]|nr:FAD:protein FMN transferase [Armatimonadota bacterium]
MHQFTWRAMGTEFTLYLPDGEREWAVGVAGELQEETRRLERQLSLYLPDSDLCYLNAHAHQQPIRVEPELFRLLQTCQSLYALTQGAFDPTVTPLLRLWGFVDKQYRVPDPDAIEQALERVGMELVLLEPSGCWVYYALPGVELSFGAIGKGWAIAQCLRILRELGVANALLDAGGSTLYALGMPAESVALTPSPSPTGWERGVGAHGGAPCGAFPLSRLAGEGDKGGEGGKAPMPSEAQSGWLVRLPDGSEMRLQDAALAVAGDTEQYFEVNGIRYGHIIDPRTGYPAPSRPPVAVIGDDPTLCDALSTVLYIEPALESIVRTRCRSVSVSTAIDGCGK